MFGLLNDHELFMLTEKLMSAYRRSAHVHIRRSLGAQSKSGQEMWKEIAELWADVERLV